MGRLEDEVVLVTGAARGQGEAAARLFVAEGQSLGVLGGDCLRRHPWQDWSPAAGGDDLVFDVHLPIDIGALLEQHALVARVPAVDGGDAHARLDRPDDPSQQDGHHFVQGPLDEAIDGLLRDGSFRGEHGELG